MSVTTQYSDSVPPVTITASDVPGDTLDVLPAWDDAGTIPGGLTLVGAGGPGSGEWTLGGIADLAPGTHTAILDVVDDDGDVTPVSIEVYVSQEDAEVAFDAANPDLVMVDAEGDSGPFVLRAVLSDSPDGYPGNIGYAGLGMTLQPIGPGTAVPGACTQDTVGSWTCSFDDVPANGYIVEATVGEFYIGSGESLLTVGDAKGGYTKGRGWYRGSDEDGITFAFGARYARRSEQLRGWLGVTHHGDDGRSRLRIRELTGLAVGHNWAVFMGTGFYRPAGERWIAGCQAIVYVEDRPDRIWIDASCNGESIAELTMPPPAPDNAVRRGGGYIKVRR